MDQSKSTPPLITTVFPSIHTLSGLVISSLPPGDKEPEIKAPGTETEVSYKIGFKLTPGRPGSVEEFNIGGFGNEVDAVIRLTRDKVYWIFPTISSTLPSHVDTQILLIRLRSGQVAAFLPLTTPLYMGTFRGSSFGTVIARFEKETKTKTSKDFGFVVVSFGKKIQDVVRNVVSGARFVRFGVSGNSPPPEEQIFANTLTYCTWNSLHPPTSPTSNNALATLRYFAENNIYPTNFLIDDAWQDVENFRLQSFGTNAKFLDGMDNLGNLVQQAKDVYGVKTVGAWHTIGGYWCGVEPTKFIGKYRLVKVTKDGYPGPFEPDGFSYYIPHPDDVGAFFDDYYAILAGYGITFTKCDNMASLDNLISAFEVSSIQGGEEVLGRAVDIFTIRNSSKMAVKMAAQKWFGAIEGRVIWCMEMSPRVLLGEEIGMPPSPSTRAILRNSDDYYPDQPDSHRYHIFTNAVNALFTSQLNVIPDLDMFQSHPYIRPDPDGTAPPAIQSTDDYPQAAFHASMRSLGAGPVTLTDVPGKTDPKILNRLIGSRTKGGRSIALQANSSPFVSNDVFDPTLVQSGVGRALRVFSRSALGGVIGYWNIRSDDGKVEDEVTVADVQDLLGPASTQSKAVLLSLSTGELRVVEATHSDASALDGMKIQLQSFGFDLITVAPLLPLSPSTPLSVALLGLVDKYNSLAGIASYKIADSGGEIVTLNIDFACGGVAAVYLHGRETSDGVLISVDGKPVSENDIQATAHFGGHLYKVDLHPFLEGRVSDLPLLLELQIPSPTHV